MKAGLLESLERLAEELARGASADRTALEILAVRMVDAPPARVWEMWTQPRHLARWWGPHGFTTTTEEMDVRPGGIWRFEMRGPDGALYPNEIVYSVVRHPYCLVYQHTVVPRFEQEVTFAEMGGKTRVMVRMRFASVAERETAAQEFHAEEGLTETMARLERELATP